MVEFIDKLIETNLCMMQDLFHLCIIELAYFSNKLKSSMASVYGTTLVAKFAEHHINFDIMHKSPYNNLT